MATKKIALNEDPHVAEVGPHKLLFQPEVYGDEFLDAYARLQDVQKTVSGEDMAALSGDRLRTLYGEMRGFLARLMLPESAANFSRHEVLNARPGTSSGSTSTVRPQPRPLRRSRAPPHGTSLSGCLTGCWSSSWSGASSCTGAVGTALLGRRAALRVSYRGVGVLGGRPRAPRRRSPQMAPEDDAQRR